MGEVLGPPDGVSVPSAAPVRDTDTLRDKSGERVDDAEAQVEVDADGERLCTPVGDPRALALVELRGVAEGVPHCEALGEAESDGVCEAAEEGDGLEEALRLAAALADFFGEAQGDAEGVAHTEKRAVTEGELVVLREDVSEEDTQGEGVLEARGCWGGTRGRDRQACGRRRQARRRERRHRCSSAGMSQKRRGAAQRASARV